MKKIKLINLAVLTLAVLTFGSCKKEGCTDTDATNFNESAKKDDNSCQYEGRMIFWYNQEIAQEFSELEVASLKFYLDGELIGSKATTTYFNIAPDCDNSSVINATKSLGTLQEKTYQLRVVDEDGDDAWRTNVTFKANTCTQFQLTAEAGYPDFQ